MRLRHAFAVLLATPSCGGIIDATNDAMADAMNDAMNDAMADAMADATIDAIPDAHEAGEPCHTIRDGGPGPCYGANGPGYETYDLYGDLSTCGFVDAGSQPPSVCAPLCKPYGQCTWDPSKPGKVVCSCTCGGRLTDGFAVASEDYFAGMAQLEAISVFAFRRLARELALHGAPAHLRARCHRAAREEVRHARIMARLARTAIRWPPIRKLPTRPLAEVAIENAIEGCVRETWGALFGAWQAEHAADADVRTAMRAVARDELGHAELSWAIHRWAMRRVSANQRGLIRDAMKNAIGELRRSLQTPESLRLFAGMEKMVWSRLGACNAPIAPLS